MSKKFAVFVIVVLGFGVSVFYSGNALAYSDKTTHPALTSEIVDFYNLTHGANAITEEEKQWMMEGSTLEDTPPRWINHFYDPVYNVGWTGEHAGNLSPEEVRKWSHIVLWGDKPLSSVEWVGNGLAQESYFRYGGDRTWKKALSYWADSVPYGGGGAVMQTVSEEEARKNKEESYRTLGFILHLVEDAGVPDHTRNDTHAEPVEKITGDPGSPLEQYAEQFTPSSIKQFDTVQSLAKSGAAAPQLPRIEDYIISVARYSNKYFFSKDTINDPKYEFPKVVRDDGNFGYGVDEDGGEIPLVKVKETRKGLGYIKTYVVEHGDDFILSAYFSRLARQIVLHGAGAIDLFYRQGADAIVNKEFPSSMTDISRGAKKTLNFAANFDKFSAVGEAAKLPNLVGAAGGFFKNAASAAKNFFNNLGGLAVSVLNDLTGAPAPDRTAPAPQGDAGAGEPALSPAPRDLAVSADASRINPIAKVEAEPRKQDSAVPPRARQTPPPPEPVSPDTTPAVKTQTLASAPTPSAASLAEPPAASAPPAPTSWGISSSPAPQPPSPSGGGGAAPTASAPAPEQKDQNDSGTESPPEPAPTSTAPSALADHIVVSEVLFDAAGRSDVGKEFVELYNPTGAAVNLEKWSLKYVSGDSTSTNPLATVGGKSEDAASIPANGFFLIGLNSYDASNYGGRAADVSRKAALLNGSGSVVLSLFSGEGILIDQLSYTSSSISEPGESLERKAVLDGACVAAGGSADAEFSGNGCDRRSGGGSGAGDFDARANPDPQNSQSLPEPRKKPLAPAALEDNPAGIVSFSPSTLALAFAWRPSEDALGSTSTLTYKIFDAGAGASSSLIVQTTSTSYSFSAPEYGKEYAFELRAFDRGGLGSATATAKTTVPDWLLTVQGEKNEQSRDSFMSDNWYNLGTGFYGTIYAMIFDGGVEGGNDPNALQDSTVLLREYLDSNYSVKNREFTVSQGKDFTREMKEVVTKGLNIPLQPNKYYRLWTWNSRQGAYVALGGSSSSTANGFTGGGAAMYNEFVYGVGTVERTYGFYPFLRLVRRPDYPPQSAPTAPAITALDFDEFGMRLGVNWASSTDADTTDNLIKYEVNYSTSTELSDGGWSETSTRPFSVRLEFPNSYKVGVRAKDDFGNTSAPTAANWSFPEGFTPLVLSNSVGGAAQDFTLSSASSTPPVGASSTSPAAIPVKSIKVFTSDFRPVNIVNPNVVVCTLDLFEVTATGTVKLASADRPYRDGESEPYAYRGYGCAGSLAYTFSSSLADPANPPRIEAGKTYRWSFSLLLSPPNAASVKFWGHNADTAGGLFSDPSIVNAKFEVDSDGGVLFAN